ncbi:hypothetical protein BH23GEM9_BH23GEM9_21410 [soil metagenome]
MHEPEEMRARSGGRVTPYELVFGGDTFDESRFELLREQVDAHGAATPTALFMLPAAGELLRDLLPGEDGNATHSEVVAQVSALMFHAFRFWRHGRIIRTLPEAETRALLDSGQPIGEWLLRTPAPAGYVQLPRNLLWARVADDAAAEPVDGFFWSSPTSDEGLRGERLDLLVCLGVRRGRPGVSIMDVSIESAGPLQHWADVEARPGGHDFANVLPGGELQGYHSLMTQAEVLKLASRCFHHLDNETDGAPVSDTPDADDEDG